MALKVIRFTGQMNIEEKLERILGGNEPKAYVLRIEEPNGNPEKPAL